jgi:hypothetical protein
MTPEDVKQLFAGNRFGPPCDEAQLAGAEAELQVVIPPELRCFYLAFDGFLGPAAAYFFWPLFSGGNRGDIGFVERNRGLRAGCEFPKELMHQCLFFGDDGCGSNWGLHQGVPGKVIAWEGALGEKFEIAGTDPGDVWLRMKRRYDQATVRPSARIAAPPVGPAATASLKTVLVGA